MRLRTLTSTGLTTLAVLLGGPMLTGIAAGTVSPVGPPFGSFSYPTGVAIDQSTGNVYVADGGGAEQVQVFGPEGESPVGGGPSSLTGEASPSKAFSFGNEPAGPGFDNACFTRKLSGGTCAAFDASSGALYIPDVRDNLVDKYLLNSSHEYEFVCEFTGHGGFTGSACSSNGGSPGEGFREPLGTAVDSAGDVYIADYGSRGIYEFNPVGEEIQAFHRQLVSEPQFIAVDDSTGTIYVQPYNSHALVELKRSSLTGAVESEFTLFTEGVTGVAFEQATGRLLVDLGSVVEDIDATGKVLVAFGAGTIEEGRGIAINETTDIVYVVSKGAIQRFGPLKIAPPTCNDVFPSASHITNEGQALLAGVVNPENLPTTYHIVYGTTTAYGMRTPADLEVGSGIGDVAVDQAVGDLAPSTTYHFALVASNVLGSATSEDATFTTPPATPPIVTTGGVEGLTHATATVSGTVDPDGLPTVYSFEYGTSTAYGTSISGSAGSATGATTLTANLLGLAYASTYHYRLVAVNRDGVSYGEDHTFTTLSFPNPFNVPSPPPFVHAPAVAFPTETIIKAKPKSKRKPTKAKKHSKHRKDKSRAKSKKKK